MDKIPTQQITRVRFTWWSQKNKEREEEVYLRSSGYKSMSDIERWVHDNFGNSEEGAIVWEIEFLGHSLSTSHSLEEQDY